MSLPKINHTQVSNAYIDQWMPRMKPYCTAVFLAIARKTIGWQKETELIRLSQLSKMTNLSKRTIQQAVHVLEANSLIMRSVTGSGKGRKTRWTINYEIIEVNGAQNSPMEASNGAGNSPIPDSNGAQNSPSKRNLFKEKEKETDPAMILWNSLIKDPIPSLLTFNQERKNKLLSRVAEGFDLKVAIDRIMASDFLMGKNDRGWCADFDWLVKNEKNWVKVMEGKYDNRAPVKKKSFNPERYAY